MTEENEAPKLEEIQNKLDKAEEKLETIQTDLEEAQDNERNLVEAVEKLDAELLKVKKERDSLKEKNAVITDLINDGDFIDASANESGMDDGRAVSIETTLGFIRKLRKATNHKDATE